MTVIGAAVLPTTVEQRITDTVKQWAPTYLRHYAQLLGGGRTLPTFRTWGLGDIDERLGEQDITPALFVECGPSDATGHASDYSEQWTTTLAIVCRSELSMHRVRELCGVYSTAVVQLLLEQGIPDGSVAFAGREPVGILSAETRRYLAQIETRLAVNVPQSIEIGPGPAVPDPDTEPPDTPTVAEDGVLVTVDELAPS